jgi:hypothetical protein
MVALWGASVGGIDAPCAASSGLFVMICLVVEAADEGGLKKHHVLV